MDFPRWPVTYYEADSGAAIWQDEGEPPPFKLGDGIILSAAGYRRFRVIDIWHSYDHHGRFDDGTHVFLVDVSETPEDRPYNIAPDYFTPSE